MAGKTGTATNDKGEVSSSWFVGTTPQISTAVMYVRGKGREQLEGFLPEFFGGSYPARTWTDVMGRVMEGMEVEEFPEPVYVDGDAPEDGHDPYTPPPSPTKRPPTKTPTPTLTEGTPTDEPTPTETVPTTPTETVPLPPTTAPPPPPTDGRCPRRPPTTAAVGEPAGRPDGLGERGAGDGGQRLLQPGAVRARHAARGAVVIDR